MAHSSQVYLRKHKNWKQSQSQHYQGNSGYSEQVYQ
jgi:hypothetical protein